MKYSSAEINPDGCFFTDLSQRMREFCKYLLIMEFGMRRFASFRFYGIDIEHVLQRTRMESNLGAIF